MDTILQKRYSTCVPQIQLSTHDFDLSSGNALSYACTGFGSSVALLCDANWPGKLCLRGRAQLKNRSLEHVRGFCHVIPSSAHIENGAFGVTKKVGHVGGSAGVCGRAGDGSDR
jgi:hypothetical protein